MSKPRSGFAFAALLLARTALALLHPALHVYGATVEVSA